MRSACRPQPHRREPGRGRGGAAVEFALVFPLLIALIFGVVEFGWAVNQKQDVRRDAREAARLASVDFAGALSHPDALLPTLCERLGSRPGTRLTVEFPEEQTAAGHSVAVTVEAELATLTGIIGPLLAGKHLTATAVTVLELDASYGEIDDEACPGDAGATPTPGPTPTVGPTPTPAPGAPTPTPTPTPCLLPNGKPKNKC